MKITMFVTEDAMQFNLEPESEHEKEMMSIMNKFTGEVVIHNGVTIAESMGHYYRNYGESSKITAIVLSKPKPKTND